MAARRGFFNTPGGGRGPAADGSAAGARHRPHHDVAAELHQAAGLGGVLVDRSAEEARLHVAQLVEAAAAEQLALGLDVTPDPLGDELGDLLARLGEALEDRRAGGVGAGEGVPAHA